MKKSLPTEYKEPPSSSTTSFARWKWRDEEMVRAHKVSPRHIRKWLPEWSYGWWWWCVCVGGRGTVSDFAFHLCAQERWKVGNKDVEEQTIKWFQFVSPSSATAILYKWCPPTLVRIHLVTVIISVCGRKVELMDWERFSWFSHRRPFGQLKWDFVSRISSRG